MNFTVSFFKESSSTNKDESTVDDDGKSEHVFTGIKKISFDWISAKCIGYNLF